MEMFLILIGRRGITTAYTLPKLRLHPALKEEKMLCQLAKNTVVKEDWSFVLARDCFGCYWLHHSSVHDFCVFVFLIETGDK